MHFMCRFYGSVAFSGFSGSNLLRGGAPVKAVQQLAWHASAKMTLDTYSHVLEQDLGGVVDLLK